MTEARLFPRLLPGAAEKRLTALLHLTGAPGFAGPQSLAAEASTDVARRIFAAVGAPRVTSQELETLREAALLVAGESGFPRALRSDDARREFDLQMIPPLAAVGMFPAEATNKPVWNYLALHVLPDVTFWRWPPSSEGKVNRDRFVAGRIDRHAYARLWWQGFLARGTDGSLDEAVRLLDLPEGEVDQVFTRRDAFARNPDTVRALLEMWGRRRAQLAATYPKVRREDVLEPWLMNVLVRGAFVAFDVMDPDTMAREFEKLLDEAVDRYAATLSGTTRPAQTRPARAGGAEAASIRSVPPDVANADHADALTRIFEIAIADDDLVSVSVEDRLVIGGALEDDAVKIDIKTPHNERPNVPDPDRHRRLLELGFSDTHGLAYLAVVQLNGGNTARVVGTLIARALSEVFEISPDATLHQD